MAGTFIVLVGPSGAGKTTLARRLVDGGVVDPDCVLDSDAYRAAINGHELDQRGHAAVFDALAASASALLRQGRTVVHSATSLKQSDRDADVAVADRCGARKVAIVFDVPLHVLLERDAARTEPRGEAVVRRLYRRSLDPGTFDAFDEVWTADVDGLLAPGLPMTTVRHRSPSRTLAAG